MIPRRVSQRIAPVAFRLGLYGLLAAAFSAAPARALPILDQSFDPSGNITHSSGVGTGFDKAQIFTAGISGQLTRVDVFIDSIASVNGTMDLEIRFTTGPGGGPATGMGASLALLTVPIPSIPSTVRSFIVFDVSAFNVQVLQGQSYAIVLTAATGVQGTGIGWYGQSPGPYAGGEQWNRLASTGNVWAPSSPASDLGFRTYVLAVPAPGPSVLIVLGLVGVNAVTKPRARRR